MSPRSGGRLAASRTTLSIATLALVTGLGLAAGPANAAGPENPAGPANAAGPVADAATLAEIEDQVSGGLNQAGTQATCYSGAARTVFLVGRTGGDAGPFQTSTRCRDINVRNDSGYSTHACVIFVDVTGNCNYWTYLPAKSSYRVVATNVRDGVRFVVRFSNSFYQYDPLISYTAY
nr:hypothetical protein [Micromonospora sp. DSM 115978]